MPNPCVVVFPAFVVLVAAILISGGIHQVLVSSLLLTQNF